MAALVSVAETIHCPVIRHGIGTVEKDLATARCKGVACRMRCKDAACPGIALREMGLEHRQLQQHLHDLGERFTANMVRRGLEPYSELWVHGPFPSKNLTVTLSDPDSSSLFGKMARRIPTPEAGGMLIEHPELALPAVFEIEAGHLRDYQFIGWFIGDEQTISTRSFWTGDRSGFERIPIGAQS